MPNGTYGGVRGKGAKAKTLAPRPTRFIGLHLSSMRYSLDPQSATRLRFLFI